MSQDTFYFDDQSQQLLNLIKASSFPDKEVFLRELILNASDALDKIRYKSITGYPVSRDPNFRIRIIPDKTNNTLSVIGNGIGMTRDDLINKLFTMERPEIKALMQTLQSGADIKTISPFNLGFYSAFLVAKRVTVISKSDDEEKQWRWESAGDGKFTVSDDSGNPERLVRGSKVILNLRDDSREFLEEEKLREVIRRCCDFIGSPIELQVRRTEEDKTIMSVRKEKKMEMEMEGMGEKTTSRKIEEEKAEEKRESGYEWEKVNKTKPIWMKKPGDIKCAEYNAFYKSLTHDLEDPRALTHFSGEGQVEFTALLFIPKKRPSDVYTPLQKSNKIRLYIRRVLITDEFEDLLPNYLNFVSGVVDSEDLPLNVPQDMLHRNKIVTLIRRSLTRKVLELIQEISQDKQAYKEFYEQFSKNIKLEFYEDEENKEKLAELLRFYSSNSGDELVSLREYAERMKEDQKNIYYIRENSRDAAKSSPFVAPLLRDGYEVIYMVDPIDEYVIDELKEYYGRELRDCSKKEMEAER